MKQNNNFKKILGLLLSIGKAFFSAIVQVAWGIASFFLLLVLITYYKQDSSAITTLMDIIFFIQKNWGLFFVILFFWNVLVDYGEFKKATEEKKKWK